MSIFNSMMIEQKNLVIALPYRVGLYVSKSDTSGGDEAESKELQALATIIDGFGRDVFGSELVQEIMAETLNRKADWPLWHEDWQKVPQECSQALGVLAGYTDAKEVNAYSARLTEIAEAVALAFCEYDDTPGLGLRWEAFKAYCQAKIKAKKLSRPMRSYEQFLNISPQERKALRHISAALGTYSLI